MKSFTNLSIFLVVATGGLVATLTSSGRVNGRMALIKIHDEFNTTENPIRSATTFSELLGVKPTIPRPLSQALKKTLLRIKLKECCPTWHEIIQLNHIQEEQKRLFGKSRAHQLKPDDLINEIRHVFVNITYYSIDGQEGQTEWEKYYKFHDNVQYFIRLGMLARDLMSISADNNHTQQEEAIDFRRQIKNIQFKTAQDPIISSFIQELQQQPDDNNNFDLYETFIKNTTFGLHYAHNISMVRDYTQRIELICSNLDNLRPSKTYETIRQMIYEVFSIRKDLLDNVNVRILSQRQDVRRAFKRLDNLIDMWPLEDSHRQGDTNNRGVVGSPRSVSNFFG